MATWVAGGGQPLAASSRWRSAPSHSWAEGRSLRARRHRRGSRPSSVASRTPSSSSRRPASRTATTSSSSRARSASSRRASSERRRSSTSAPASSQAASRAFSASRFPKNYAKTRAFYVNYTATGSGATVIDRYRVRSGRALPASREQLLTVPQPYANHNGGHLAFGPDGKLWVGLGDGGSGGDPENRAQDRSTLLGKMFRLDVAKRSPGPELVAVGLRNPWRYTFDRRTGDLWIGDVGQDEIEEVSVLRRPFGALVNFGWDVYEGRARFEDKELGPGRLVQPVAQYSHCGRLLDHGRLRLPRERGREPSQPLRLRRLLQRHDLEHPGCGRRAEGRAGEGREPRLVRRRPQGRALRDLTRRNDLPLPLAPRCPTSVGHLQSPATPLVAAPAATARAPRTRPRSASR